MIWPCILPAPAANPFFVGQGVETKAIPTRERESAPTGKVRVVPQKPFISPTRAVYEWRVVCDRPFGSFAQDTWTLNVSNVVGTPARLQGDPTVFTSYVEVDTTPYGDGSMKTQIYQGHWSGAVDPLFPADGKLPEERGSYVSWGNDGYEEQPAGSFVRRLLVTRQEFPLNETVELAHLALPVEKFGYMIARNGDKDVSKKAVPVDSECRFAPGVLSSPEAEKLRRQGFTVVCSYGRLGEREGTHRLVVTSVPSARRPLRFMRSALRP